MTMKEKMRTVATQNLLEFLAQYVDAHNLTAETCQEQLIVFAKQASVIIGDKE